MREHVYTHTHMYLNWVDVETDTEGRCLQAWSPSIQHSPCYRESSQAIFVKWKNEYLLRGKRVATSLFQS